MLSNISYLLVFYLLLIASGKTVIDKISLVSSNEIWLNKIFLSLAVGFILFSQASLFVASIKNLYTTSILLFLVFLFAISFRNVTIIVKGSISFLLGMLRSLRNQSMSKESSLYLGLFILVVLLNFIFANTPPTDTDSLLYHLAFPKLFLKSHELLNIVNHPLNFLTFNGEMLYVYHLMLRNDIAAKMFYYSFGVIDAVLIYYITRHYLTFEISLLASVIFYLSPPVINHAGLCKIDYFHLYFSLLAFMYMLKYSENYKLKYYVIASVLSAFSISIKLTNIPMFFCIVFFDAYILVKTSKSEISHVVKKYVFHCIIFIVFIILFTVPWLLRNYNNTENPLPYMQIPKLGFFIDQMYAVHKSTFDISKPSIFGMLKVFYNLFIGNPVNSFGPILLIFSIPVIFLKNSNNFIKTTAYFAVTFLIINYISLPVLKDSPQYYFLSLALFSILASYCIYRIREHVIYPYFIFLAVIINLIFPGLLLSTAFAAKRVKYFINMESDAEYIKNNLWDSNIYWLVTYINDNIGNSDNVLFMGSEFIMGLYYYNPNVTVADPKYYLLNKDLFQKILKSENYKYLVFNKSLYVYDNICQKWKNRISKHFDLDFDLSKEKYLKSIYENQTYILYEVATN